MGGVSPPADSTAISEFLGALLRNAVEAGASDVHLKVPSEPLMRIDGALVRLPGIGRVTPDLAEACLASMLAGLPHSARHVAFETRGEVDFTVAQAGLGRFRVNAYRQRGSITLVLRPVPFTVPRLDALGLPAGVAELAGAPEGLVLVCGPAGSGVTTTIAALIDRMNDGPARSIITVEDPIEVLHSDRVCAINQREVGLDTASFPDALARVLRQDPDVVMIGSLDDPRTLEIALDAVASGVLVIAATGGAEPAEAVERLIARVPPHRQAAVRTALGGALRAVVSQRLVSGPDGTGRRAEVRTVSGTDRLAALVRAAARSG